MGRKVNPIGFRLPVRRDWKSRWYAKGRDFADMVIKDASARRMIEKDYVSALISKIEIEQKIGSPRVVIHAARPGVVIGKKGEGIESLRKKLRRVFDVTDVRVDMKEIAQPETDAKVIALNIASQLENRVMFRRAMRRAMSNAMRLKVDGIKIKSAGRLNGIEIARTEWYHEGRVPLHTLKNDIDYGFAEANTPMGVVGVKVWVSKGDTFGLRKKAKYTFDGTEEAPVVSADDGLPPPVADAADAAPADKVAKTVVARRATADAAPKDADEEKPKPRKRTVKKAAPAAEKAADKADKASKTTDGEDDAAAE